MKLVPTEERYPWAALMQAMGNPTLHAAGRKLHVAGTTLYEYRDRGLTAHVADRLAIRAGLHPAMVWGWAWVDDGLTTLDRLYLEQGWRQAWLWRENAA